MTALIAVAAIGLCAVGVFTGIIGAASVAIRREEKSLTMTSEATGKVLRVGRWVNGVYVRVPRRTAAVDRDRAFARPAGRPAPDPRNEPTGLSRWPGAELARPASNRPRR
jgi:hypothetical protein